MFRTKIDLTTNSYFVLIAERLIKGPLIFDQRDLHLMSSNKIVFSSLGKPGRRRASPIRSTTSQGGYTIKRLKCCAIYRIPIVQISFGAMLTILGLVCLLVAVGSPLLIWRIMGGCSAILGVLLTSFGFFCCLSRRRRSDDIDGTLLRTKERDGAELTTHC